MESVEDQDSLSLSDDSLPHTSSGGVELLVFSEWGNGRLEDEDTYLDSFVDSNDEEKLLSNITE